MKVSLIPAFLLLVGSLAVSCNNESRAPTQIELEETADASSPAPPVTVASPIEGWNGKTANLPALLPAEFELRGADDELLTGEALRGQWTILALWGLWSEDSLADIRYMQALRSAVDQDPDLDFMAVHTPDVGLDGEASEQPYGAYLSLAQGVADQGASFDSGEDAGGDLAKALGIKNTPTYLLVGPDLAIEAVRGAIAKDETDGIKSMIRGVAQIRSQIASP